MNRTLMEERWLRRLFLVLALLYVLPFWIIRYIPTTDGPCHTYNAWILRQYGNVAEYPLFRQYYEINAKPFPNWIGQATMALLMFVFRPVVAEKLLVSGYVLLFLTGVWYFAGSVRPEERWLAFLAFPFVYNQLFQFGFYNFVISLALFPVILGFWWRHRAHPGLAFAVAINLLLWLCYFSHILSFVFALIAIAFLWLATLRWETWRRHLLHVLILLPQAALPAWFFSVQQGGQIPTNWTPGEVLRYFARLEVLYTFSEVQIWLGTALVIVFVLLLVLTFWRRSPRRPFFRREDVFLLLALLSAGFYFLGPGGMAGGYLLKHRLSLYPFLFLIAGLSPRLPRRGEQMGAIVLATAALLNLGYLLHWYGLRGAEVARFVDGLAPVRPNVRVLGLLFQRTGPTDVASHAVSYMAIQKGLIDWDNYQARTSFFPTRFRDSVVFPNIPHGVLYAGDLPVGVNWERIDAIYTWQMPAGVPLRWRLRRFYRVTARMDGGVLWERRARFRP